MAKMSMAARRALPISKFAIPEKAPGPGSYPERNKKQAVVAKGMAAMHASPAVKKRVDSMANRILGDGPRAISMNSMPGWKKGK